ncbi:helix-turn-helix domain-containing protein [Hydrogenophaga sp.]|uniref:helix-turn-helix domain-containing protein n=1 Tax=Hydrogenophaga sp. TaxID=1904254 RepID=UPI0026332743|nr:helix-turn-helix domain-containing protein [Hydrogenophaga sp.]
MEMIGKVRRMRLRDRLSLSEIARRTGLSRNTVKKWLKEPEAAMPKYQRRDTAGKLTAFEAQLQEALQGDARRPKRDRRTSRALFAQLKAQGYAGGHTLVAALNGSFVEFDGSGALGHNEPLMTGCDLVGRCGVVPGAQGFSSTSRVSFPAKQRRKFLDQNGSRL